MLNVTFYYGGISTSFMETYLDQMPHSALVKFNCSLRERRALTALLTCMIRDFGRDPRFWTRSEIINMRRLLHSHPLLMPMSTTPLYQALLMPLFEALPMAISLIQIS